MRSTGNRVYIAILNQGSIRPELANLLIHISHDPRYQINITYPNARPITNSRSQIVKAFLDSSADYLLMIDSDIVPGRNPMDMIANNLDIVGFPCPQWHETDLYWVVMDEDDQGYKPIPPKRRVGLKKVDAIGTGCILIARSVLERVTAPFTDNVAEDGTLLLGEDFNFCRKAKAAGFQTWCDWATPCSHHKTLDLLEVFKLLSNPSGA